MAKHFIRKKEDFVCVNCGEKVTGTGYTNHCHKCLFSLHVDKDVPGDRLSKCKGEMEPVRSESKSGGYMIVHKCKKCGKITRNKASKNDNFETILDLTLLA